MNEYKKKNKKHKFFNIDHKIENIAKSKTTKMLINFNCLDSALTLSFRVNKPHNVKLTSRFLSGKKLITYEKISDGKSVHLPYV